MMVVILKEKRKKKKKNKNKNKNENENENEKDEKIEEENKESSKQIEEPKVDKEDKIIELMTPKEHKFPESWNAKKIKNFIKYLPKNTNTDLENYICDLPEVPRINLHADDISYLNPVDLKNQVKISDNYEQSNAKFVLLGDWKNKENCKQTTPPTLDINSQGFDKLSSYPEGIIYQYTDQKNMYRTDDLEKKELEKFYKYRITSLRKAALAHKQIRKYIQSYIKPGIKLIDMCKELEKMLKFICNSNKIECGQSFPVGCSLNNCAAHYTPNIGDETILKEDDVMKLDFGTQMNGYIIDTAFTVAFNPIYENLLKASKEATLYGVKNAGIDVRVIELGEGISEIINSYEVEIKGKNHKIRPILDLMGHSIERYKIHSTKSVPLWKNMEYENMRMEEGEIYAIETFATTGKGKVAEKHPWSHYMLNYENYGTIKIKNQNGKKLYKFIDENYKTMGFCPRWIHESGELNDINIDNSLKYLCQNEIVDPYPMLCDIEGSYVSQFEHTLMLKPTGKEIFTIDDDY